MRSVISALSGLMLGAAALAAPASAVAAEPTAAWIQHVDGTAAEVRAVISAETCPIARVDGAALALERRIGPEPGFDNAVCAARLPPGARTVEVGGVRLKPPSAALRRVLILGDTGCRLKGATIQACNDAAAWPFRTVARLAAAKRPDLIIHVGDYFYRETACPAGEAGCKGSPYGDRQTSWDADLLRPGRALLTAAPWVFVRGNHESCARGARGWFRMFDAGPEPLTCPAAPPPFSVDLPGLKLLVTDGADADDRFPSPQTVAAFGRQLDGVLGQGRPPGGSTWLLTHRPIWAMVPVLQLGPLGGVEVGINLTQQRALRGRSLEGVEMIVSGHIHHFAAYDFGAARPSQLVVGTGGDEAQRGDSARLRSSRVTIDGAEAQRFGFSRFGYLMLERAGAGWVGAFHDVDDKVVATCQAEGRSLRCRAAGKS